MLDDLKEVFDNLHDKFWDRYEREVAEGNAYPISAVGNGGTSAAGGLALNLLHNKQTDHVADITRVIINTDLHTPAVPYPNFANADSASIGTTNAPVVGPGAGAVLCVTGALVAGFYDVTVSASTGPGAATIDAGNMALQLNGATILRIPVPAAGSDSFGPIKVNVPANGVLQVIAIGAGTALVSYTAEIVATPRLAVPTATAYLWLFIGDASSFNIASVIDYAPVEPNGTVFPARFSYGLKTDPVLMPGEKLAMLLVGGPINANVSSFVHGQYVPKKTFMDQK